MSAIDALAEAPASVPRWRATPDGRLTDDMRRDYEAAGVLVLEDFVPAAACRRLVDRAHELVEAFDPAEARSVFSTTSNTQHADRYFTESGDKIRFFFEEGAFDDAGRLRRPTIDSLNKIGHALHDLDPVFDAFSRTPALAALAASVGLDDPVIIQSMLILKPPHIGGEVSCHQDSTYLYTEPETCTGFWFALEDATLANGCMYFIPGAHRGPLKALHARGADGRLATRVLDASPWPLERLAPVEAGTGSLVLFDGRAPHLSGPNRSARSRHAYTLHAIEAHATYPAGNWLQRDPALPLRGFR